LGAVQGATAAGSKTLGAATSIMGTAMGGARAAGGGLLALIGGPMTLGIGVATVAMSLFGKAIDAVKDANERIKQGLATSVDVLAELKKEAAETADETIKLSLAMGDSETGAYNAASAYDRQAVAAAGAARAIRDMTLAQQVQELNTGEKQLKDLQASLRTTGFMGLVTTDTSERAVKARDKLLDGTFGNETQRRFTGKTDAQLVAELRGRRDTLPADDLKNLNTFNKEDAAVASLLAAIEARKTRNEALNKALNGGQPETPTLVDEIVVTADRTKKGRADTKGFNAGVTARDAAADVAAENARTAAIIAGGKALDQWQISEAGRQAVEKTSLADKPKLPAAETALIGQIRQSAEETERLKLANERLVKGADLTRSAQEDTAALQARAVAAGQGVAAMEALAVKEAGLDALHQIGVESLDQLTGKTLEQAKAAMAAAEAAEAQGIATGKAERVADQIRDLDKRIAAEKGYAAALGEGEEALVAYQRAEFVRQEIEKAGENLTKDQVAALKAKAEALFAVQAAADSAQLNKRMADELRLSQLTNRERDLEQRFLERKSLLLAEHVDWTKQEVDARAHALALADQAAAEDAAAIGQLREGLREEFIQSGKLGFDQVADYAEQKLRAAVYDALLAKPIDIIINAIVGSVSGASGLGAGGGLGGIGSLFNSSGGLAGLASASGNLITDLLMKGGMGGLNATKFGGAIGGAFGGAGTGALVSSLAGMLGLKQSKGNQIGSTIGGIAGSFIPIPGGSLIGSVIGNVIGGLIGGKKSNSAAVVSLDAAGQITNVGGAKRTDETTAAATSVAQGVASFQAALIAAGATLGTTVSVIDLGVRDSTHIGLSNGQTLETAVGDTKAAIEASIKAIVAGASWGSDAATAYAQKMITAGASLDEIVATMQAATGLPKSIDDAILQLTDPAKFEREQALGAIEDSYKALKAKANEMIAAGLLSGDVLAKIDQLRDLQVADTLKQLGDAAAEAAAQIAEQAAQVAAQRAADVKSAADLTTSVDLAILKFTDPEAYARQSAILGVTNNYDGLKSQAEQLIEAGVLSADILAKLDQMRDLQIDEALKGLVEQVETTAEVFAKARPKLLDWLDGLATSANSPLNAEEQRRAAMASYERQLELARAGNGDALAAITGYADQLLSADRQATASAADRAALYDKVKADVEALAAQTAAVSATPMQVQLAAPDLAAFSASIETSGDKLSIRLDAIADRVEQLANRTGQGSAQLVGEVVDGLRAIGRVLSSGLGDNTDAIEQLISAQELTNATIRKAMSQ
jgi:hypothetical protein